MLGVTKQQLGEQAPPRVRSFLREPQVDAVVEYVLNTLKGKDEPTYEECVAYWDKGARQCQSMQE